MPAGGAVLGPGAGADDPRLARSGGRDGLSLALIDSRNALLARLSMHEDAASLRTALQAGAYQELWISRHVQRGRGEACDPAAVRLAGVEPRLEAWLAPDLAPPGPAAARAYLRDTLEITLELLAGTPETDEALHFFRMALMHEDRLVERWSLERMDVLDLGAPPARARREPLAMPAQRWMLGSMPGGLVPHAERWAHEVAVPEFEIDARPVDWDAFLEFAADGGYDRPEWWSAEGWRWVQDSGRRAPGGVEQLAGSVVLHRGGRLVSAPGAQPVMRVSRHEAQAWCRWAGRRLPTEPEWELAAATAASRGFAWGDVLEWVAGSPRAWHGAGEPGPWELDRPDPQGARGVLRGASFLGSPRLRHAKARRFAGLADDAAGAGFRSCAP